MQTPFRIVVGEDSTPDVLLIEEALRHHGVQFEMTVLRDGESLLDWSDRVDAGTELCPNIILLDLNLPRYDGIRVLERLKASATFASVPVVIVTSSSASSDRDAAARSGAASYFCKPLDYDEFLALGGLVKQILEVNSDSR